MPNEPWSAKFTDYYDYRPDTSPSSLLKYVRRGRHPAEFHQNWKVASTSFPDYLRCEYGADSWVEAPAAKPVGAGVPIFAAVRDPLSRWLSAASELLERAVNHWCPQGPCTSQDAFDPNVTLDRLLHQTSWYTIVDPRHGGYTQEKLGWLVRAMVRDTTCNYYTYAAEHLTSQANYVTQNKGPARDIALIIKLEDLAPGLGQMAQMMGLPGGNISGKCTLQQDNRGADKPNSGNIPTPSVMRTVLTSDSELLRELCLTYAQDFVCFEYALPDPCKELF